MATGIQITFDCADPEKVGKFWAEALGYIPQPPPEGFDSWTAFLEAQGLPADTFDSAYAVIDPDGAGPRLYFQKVPEGKTVKNRVHLDVNVGGGEGPEGSHSTPIETRKERVEAEAKRLEAAGATVVGSVEEMGEFWIVMQDVEGNEFCLQ